VTGLDAREHVYGHASPRRVSAPVTAVPPLRDCNGAARGDPHFRRGRVERQPPTATVTPTAIPDVTSRIDNRHTLPRPQLRRITQTAPRLDADKPPALDAESRHPPRQRDVHDNPHVYVTPTATATSTQRARDAERVTHRDVDVHDNAHGYRDADSDGDADTNADADTWTYTRTPTSTSTRRPSFTATPTFTQTATSDCASPTRTSTATPTRTLYPDSYVHADGDTNRDETAHGHGDPTIPPGCR